MKTRFKVGDMIAYHSVVGGPITSEGHKIIMIELKPGKYEGDVAWITSKSGCVALDALSKQDQT